MHVMARETWTDERLDDLTKHMDEGFREVRAEQRQQREEAAAEFKALRKDFTELKSQGAKTDAKIEGLIRTVQIGFWLIASFLVGLMGMFAAQL
jgi:F0F1-type ATP synthase assembly protein I